MLVWDGATRELWLDRILLKRLTRSAPAQEVLLAAFEEQGWPEEIDNPFAGDGATSAADYLNNALHGVNRGHRVVVLRFGSLCGGRKATWRLVPPREPKS